LKKGGGLVQVVSEEWRFAECWRLSSEVMMREGEVSSMNLRFGLDVEFSFGVVAGTSY
jgi:hypothetical protein